MEVLNLIAFDLLMAKKYQIQNFAVGALVFVVKIVNF